MNSLKFAKLLTLGLVLTVGAVGCKKKPYGVTPLPGQGNTQVGSAGSAPPIDLQNPAVTPGQPIPLPSFNPDDYNQDRAALASETVYFDFDSAAVKASERSKVDAVANYLKGKSGIALLVEGHCDERGTEEYNRSLGERRALALREGLAAAGADPQRVITRSFGEDKPSDPGHDESAWRKNRRGEFVVLTPK
jgi:peptidoglycan-associated lipoprotein